MDRIAALTGKKVGVDTAAFIYYIEEDPHRLSLVEDLFQLIEEGKVEAFTSMITLMEVLVHPIKSGNSELADQYKKIILNSNNLTTVAVVPEIAEEAGKLRARYSVRPADAIQIATAVRCSATTFITNDSRIPKLEEIEILVLDNLIRS